MTVHDAVYRPVTVEQMIQALKDESLELRRREGATRMRWARDGHSPIIAEYEELSVLRQRVATNAILIEELERRLADNEALSVEAVRREENKHA